MMDWMQILSLAPMILALTISVIGHEIAHALSATMCGDSSAKEQNRLSINPIKHIDLVGTIIFPILLYVSQTMAGVTHPMLFGWAKPVPVNMRVVINNKGYLGAVFVSLAGIMYNLLLAFVASLFIHFEPTNTIEIFAFNFLYYLIFINVILMIFNLLPIPPLDGANALKYFLNYFGNKSVEMFFDKIEKFGMVILLIFLFTPLNGLLFRFIHKITMWFMVE